MMATAPPDESSGVDDPHRSSFVKFVEDSDGDDEKETPFVRHNTPHPKDLKAKAQKHFKGKKIDGKVVQHDEHVHPYFSYSFINYVVDSVRLIVFIIIIKSDRNTG